MARSYIATVDPVHRRPLSVGRGIKTEWSSARVWSGLVLERIVYDEFDTPEFAVEDHCVVLHDSPVATIEHKIHGTYRSFSRGPGNICLFSAGATRQVRSRERHAVLALAISPQLVGRAVGRPDLARSLVLREHHELRDRRIHHIVRGLELEAHDGYPSGALYGESLGLALAAHLAQKYAAERLELRGLKGGLAPRIFSRVVEHIDGNLGENLRLSALAEIAGLSAYRFAHTFKTATGVSPHRFVTQQRIVRAKRMLREGAMSIAEIGRALGFSQPSRFSSVFGRWTGTTPSAYRHGSE